MESFEENLKKFEVLKFETSRARVTSSVKNNKCHKIKRN